VHYSTSDFFNGMRILYKKEPYEIIKFSHFKPGKGMPVVRTKLRNLINKNYITETFRSGDKFNRVEINEEEVEFLYINNNILYFMNLKSFEEFSVSKLIIGDKINFLKEGLKLLLVFFNEKIISIIIPNHMLFKVIKCDPAIAGNTMCNATKKAIVETGFSCQVPLFINNGDNIKIDTRNGSYISRNI